MASPVLNLSAFSAAELQALLTAAKAEVLVRLTGRVQSGTSTGQNYAMTIMTIAELNQLINSLTDALGLDADMTFVRPNFTGCGVTSDPA